MKLYVPFFILIGSFMSILSTEKMLNDKDALAIVLDVTIQNSRMIQLQNNSMTASSITEFIKVLNTLDNKTKSVIEYIDFSNDHFNKAGIKELVTFIQHTHALQVLDLSKTSLSSKHITSICNALNTHKKTQAFYWLGLDDCKPLNKQAVHALASLIIAYPKIKIITSTCFTDAFLYQVLQSSDDDKNMQTIDL